MPDERDISLPEPGPSGGQLTANIMHFARVLRRAGLPVGPGKVLDALNAVREVGITDRDDFYWALHAVFVNRRDQRELFDQAFHVFWRNPQILEKLMSMVLPTLQASGDDEREEMLRRIADALQTAAPGGGQQDQTEKQEVDFDATMTWTDQELLRTIDFEKMTADEIRRAKSLIARMRLPVLAVPTRRFRIDERGRRIDMRATLRRALRSGGHDIPLAKRQRRTRNPPLVILCDISGSMERYSRMLLHFMHAMTNDRDRVHTFLFGTRLTNITRHLRHKDVDFALEKVGEAAEDWSGGTRIGACLHQFNFFWSRRVLGQGAVVLLITDGLDREGGRYLEREMDRLHRSCRRLIWLNPLLRYDGFEPKSTGIRAMLPHVDDFRSIHNLESLDDLAAALATVDHRRSESVGEWLQMIKN